MDLELDKMLVKTVNVRSPSGAGFTPGGTPILAAAVPMAAYVETKLGTESAPGGTAKNVSHMVVTITEIRQDDLVWLPGLDPTNLNLGKRPLAINVYNDPDTGNIDHWEVTL